MHIITFFAPKGGSGRTTALMTAAAALIEAGHRVGVLDMTEQARTASRIGKSFITQWEDSMVKSGISAEELTTIPAWDEETRQRAMMHFAHSGCTRVLVDTPKIPNDLVVEMLHRSDVTVMPFTSYMEATFISEWSFTTKIPNKKVFGLPTGLTGSAEEQDIHRKAFLGAPLLNAELEHNDIYPNQLTTGSIFKMTRQQQASVDTTALHHAQTTAFALAEELNQLLRWPTPRSYATQQLLATGSQFAHFHALRNARPGVFH